MNFAEDATCVQRLIETVQQINSVALVVIDTVSRCLPGADENGPPDMTRFVGYMDQLRAATGVAVLAVHHAGKDPERGPRGHTSFIGAVDVALYSARDKQTKVANLSVVKNRDGEDGFTANFSLESVVLGTDLDGDVVTSAVVTQVDDGPIPDEKSRRSKLSAPQTIALNALQDALATGGEPVPSSLQVPAGAIGVKDSAWRAYAYQRGISGAGERARQQAFQRARQSLLVKGLVGAWADYNWIVSRP
jgi:hypothetical protein